MRLVAKRLKSLPLDFNSEHRHLVEERQRCGTNHAVNKPRWRSILRMGRNRWQSKLLLTALRNRMDRHEAGRRLAHPKQQLEVSPCTALMIYVYEA